MRSARLLASIDVLGCEAVKLVKGMPGTGLRLGDPFRLAERLHGLGATWLHVVDLDGAFQGRPSGCVLRLVSRLKRELGVRVQLGGGIRGSPAVEAAAEAGADRVVIGSAWLRRPEFLDEAAEIIGPFGVVAAVEERHDGLAVRHGWREAASVAVTEAVEEAVRHRVWGILYTQVHREGAMAGPDILRARRVAAMAESRGLQFSGGVAYARDIELLGGLGYGYVVVGMALHTWSINPLGLLA